MPVDDDVKMILDWMEAHHRKQQWRCLDRRGRTFVTTRRCVDMSRNGLRKATGLKPVQLDAALSTLIHEHLAMPVGRTLPFGDCQGVELWMLLP